MSRKQMFAQVGQPHTDLPTACFNHNSLKGYYVKTTPFLHLLLFSEMIH